MKSIPAIHNKVHFIGFLTIAIGMIFSKALMSMGVMLLILNILIEANFNEYYKKLKSSKPFLYLFSFFIIYILSFFWSTDLNYALHDFKIKIPLLAILIAVIIKPLSNKELSYIFIFIILSLFISSVINLLYYYNWNQNFSYKDIREMSLFGSHIRYGIIISLGIALCFYLMEFYEKKYQYIFLAIAIWFSIYTYYSQVISGSLTLIIVYIFTILNFLYNKNKFIFKSSLILIILFPVFVLIYFYRINSNEKIEIKKYTKEGNLYKRDVLDNYYKGKNDLYINICDTELEREWSKVSNIDYYGKDKKNQDLRYTLIRFLNSKKLSKDAFGFKKLNKKEIKYIENGIASIYDTQPGFFSRIENIKFQFNNYYNPNGKPILQRFEYWKTGYSIFKKNYLIGIGAGDNQIEFDKKYKESNSILNPENRLRAHNQFLSIIISIGIIGFIPFLLFIYSMYQICKEKTFLLGWIIISSFIITSFFEDTLETQLGVIYSSLFFSFIISHKKTS